MLTEDKVTELFCRPITFVSFLCHDGKYTLKLYRKRHYHRESTLSKSEIMVIMIMFMIPATVA